MAVMSMRCVLGAVNDRTQVKIYRGRSLVAKGNWYQDNILEELEVEADLDAVNNVCKVRLIGR